MTAVAALTTLAVRYQNQNVHLDLAETCHFSTDAANRICQVARHLEQINGNADRRIETPLLFARQVNNLKKLTVFVLPSIRRAVNIEGLSAFVLTAAAVAVFVLTLPAFTSGLANQLLFGFLGGIPSIFNYILANRIYSVVENRLRERPRPSPWFCPDLGTIQGKLVFGTLIWPILAGFILPLYEVATRVSRWEEELVEQTEKFQSTLNDLANYYKQHAEMLQTQVFIDFGEIEHEQDINPTLRELYSQLDFLHKIDPEVPPKELLLAYLVLALSRVDELPQYHQH